MSTAIEEDISQHPLNNQSENGTLTALSFFIEDALYAIPVSNVLGLSKETENIQPVPVKSPGLLGMSKYLGSMVPVLDIADRIGVPSGMTVKQQLIDNLLAREQDHIDWINALEQSINTGEAFTKARDPHQCAFGKWYDNFSSRNETLTELLEQLNEPHNKIHALADKLLALKEKGQEQQALEELQHHRITTLQRLRSLFNRTREQVNEMMRPILLFVTKDGRTPVYALLIDEVKDVLPYNTADAHSTEDTGLDEVMASDQFISAILSGQGVEDCMLFDVDKLLLQAHS